jgi:uncharacterized protein (TIGR02271 family)
MEYKERSTVVAVFDNRDQAECAVEELKRMGLTQDRIGLAMKDQPGTVRTTEETKAGEGAAAGAMTGGLLGGLLGAAASLLIPGIGPVVALGALGTTLAGAAAGAVGGGILGALAGMGVPEEEARYYDEQFRSGRIVMTARADGYYDNVYNAVRQCGGYDMHTRPEERTTLYGEQTTMQGERTIPLREERLRADKERVQSGEVEIRKDVITENKTIEVPTKREQVVIERRPAGDKPTQEAVGKDEQIRIPVWDEQVNVSKETVESEEVSVRKEQVEDKKDVSADVRRERIDVRKKGSAPVRDDETSEPRERDMGTR